QPVRTKIRFAALERRVPVHNQAAVVPAVGKKRLTNPDQVALLLRVQRQLRIDARMNEKPAAVVVAQRQRTKPTEHRLRQVLGARHTVTAQRGVAALAQPNVRWADAIKTSTRNPSWFPLSAIVAWPRRDCSSMR